MATVAVGDLIGGTYRLTQKLGEGGMGTVWAGEHIRLGKPFAIKILSGDWNELALERFKVEAAIVAKFRNPHVCEVIDFHELDDGTPYMVLEYLQGEMLESRIDRLGPLRPSALAKVIEQIGLALEDAHGQGVLHRDIKPANIFLARTTGGDEVAKLLDFGISKGPTDQNLTQKGYVMGTTSYMSPEQATAQPLDGRSDLWSLAIVIYECLTGKLPFTKGMEKDTPFDTLQAIIGKPHLPPTAHLPGAPVDLDEFFDKALAKDAKNRFQTAAAFVAEAKHVLDFDLSRNTPLPWQPTGKVGPDAAATFRATAEEIWGPAGAPKRAPLRMTPLPIEGHLPAGRLGELTVEATDEVVRRAPKAVADTTITKAIVGPQPAPVSTANTRKFIVIGLVAAVVAVAVLGLVKAASSGGATSGAFAR